MTKAAPEPIFWLLNQTSRDWIAVHVLQLLDPFFLGPDIEIIKSPLPEGLSPTILWAII